MQQSPTWEADYYSPSQSTSRLLLNSKGRYRTNKGAFLNPIHGHWDPFCTHTSRFLNDRSFYLFFFFLHLHHDFSNTLIPLGSSTKFCVPFYLFDV